MWMFFKREVMFFELPGAGGNDIFWAPRTVYFNLYAFCGASDINNFWKCLQYFIWMCFWFLYRNGSRSRSLNPSSLISLTLSLSLSDLSLSLSLTLSLSPSNSISFFLYLCFSSIFFFSFFSFVFFCSFLSFSLSFSLSLSSFLDLFWFQKNFFPWLFFPLLFVQRLLVSQAFCLLYDSLFFPFFFSILCLNIRKVKVCILSSGRGKKPALKKRGLLIFDLCVLCDCSGSRFSLAFSFYAARSLLHFVPFSASSFSFLSLSLSLSPLLSVRHVSLLSSSVCSSRKPRRDWQWAKIKKKEKKSE